MNELFEYMVPLQGLFKKKRDPKFMESYKQLDDINEIVEDFKTAKSYLNASVRVGSKCVFRKDKITLFYVKDIIKACFRIHGEDSADEYGTINLVFRDGSETVLYKTYDTDPTIATEIFTALSEKGISIK